MIENSLANTVPREENKFWKQFLKTLSVDAWKGWNEKGKSLLSPNDSPNF